ncbi:MAG: energy transducer TonB [Chthoniobacterales bacterium]
MAAALFSSAQAADSGLHTFVGEVVRVDLASHSLTIRSGEKSFLFYYNDETRISSFNHYVRWETVRPGQGAIVTMRLGDGGIGVATAVRFQDSAGAAKALDLFSARTIRGEKVSGAALSNFVVFEPSGYQFARAIDLGSMRARMFVLTVNTDGTVGAVKPVQPFPNPELNERAARWLKQWRFRPNSLTDVRIPVAAGSMRY